jgi:small basic protein (TIGR04137 family)
MSTHKSLIAKDKLRRSRNVLKRMERIDVLKERGRWSEGDSVFGLPMTRTQFKVRKGKKKKDEAKGEASTEGTAESKSDSTEAT